MARAAAEIEPLAAMRSTSSALPGPIAGRRPPNTRSVRPRYLRSGIRKEKLLAADLVGRDRVLSLARNDPVDERLAQLPLYAQVLLRIDEDDAVLVEKPPVALHRDGELAAVLERDPGAAIGEDVRVHGGCRVERRPHALPGLAVPACLLACDVDAGRLPQLELGEVRAAAVAARDESRLGLMNFLKCENGIFAAGHLRRVGLRPDQDEIVV